MMSGKLRIEANLDGTYLSQYWGGHGHVFENNLLACLPIHVMAVPGMSLSDFLMEATSQWEWDMVSDDITEAEKEEIYDYEQEIEDALLDGLNMDNINREDFFDFIFADQENLDYFNEEDSEWDTYFFGHIHVYRVTENE